MICYLLLCLLSVNVSNAEKLSKGAGYFGRFIQGSFKGYCGDWPDFLQ